MTRASDLARLLGAGGTLNAALSVDTISEKTSGSGVTIDSLNVKDGGIGGHQIGGRRNIIINGAMQVAQRATSATGISTSGYYTVDRMRIASGSTAGRFTMTQESITDLSGFANAVKLDCTTADTSIAAGELVTIGTRIEGQDLQQLKKGTSDAEKVTVSFYVKGNASATYVFELYDSDNTRQISQSFSVTTSWSRVSLTFDGDTTGAFGDDNNLSLLLQIWLHAGSEYTSGTLSTSWSSVTAANRAVGISSFFDSTDRTFFLTGLQMEVGEQATPFEHRSFGEELGLCQRYFQYLPAGSVGRWISSTTAEVCCNFPTLMRAVPTISINPNDNTCLIYRLGLSTNASTVSGISSTYISESGGMVPLTVSSTASTPSTGDFAHYDTDGASEVVFCDSEL